MLLKEKKFINQEIVTAIQCDLCDQIIETSTEGDLPEHGKLYANWGYNSQRDGKSPEYHLCEGCFGMLEAYIAKERRINQLFKD